MAARARAPTTDAKGDSSIKTPDLEFEELVAAVTYDTAACNPAVRGTCAEQI